MRLTDAYADLLRFGSVLTTDQAAARLRASVSAASKLLARLAASGLAVPVRRGLWSLDPKLDPLLLPDHLTAPFPSYVSVQSALFYHAMVSQVPRVIFVASLAPARLLHTAYGDFSIHHLAPEFFGGFAEAASGIKLATPEKALLDFLYLGRARSRLFTRLPEIEIGPDFDERAARRWIDRIPAIYQRTMVERRFDEILAAARPRRRAGLRRPRAAAPADR